MALEQGGGGHGAVRCPWSREEVAMEQRDVPGAVERQELLPGHGGRKGPPAPNGFLQIKEPQLPFFPLMAPEANVLKRKQRDCFTSHKWGRSSVGKEALE